MGEGEHRGFEKVQELLDTCTNWWDVNKVKSLFQPWIMVDILKTFILPTNKPDSFIWAQEKWSI